MDIARLLAPFLGDAPPPPLEAISTYLDLLLRWNARMNLTAVRDPESIVTRHIGESLFAATHLFPAGQLPIANCQLLDLGSGAGFPGIPIKLWVPQLTVTLIESRQRKATFLREVIRTLQLTSISVFPGRAEDYSGPLGDVVTLRAVERFDEVLPTTARLLRPAASREATHAGSRGRSDAEPPAAAHPEPSRFSDGASRLALLIGAAQVSRAHALLPAFTWSEPISIPQSSSRVLLVGAKGA